MSNTVLLTAGKDLYWLSRSGSATVDYERMLEGMKEDFNNLTEANYYAVMPSGEPESLHQLLTFLRHNGFTVHTAKSRSPNDTVNIDTKIAADMVSYAASGNYDTVVLAATSVTFTPAVRVAQNWGVRVVLAATEEKTDHRLMNAVDEFYDLKQFDSNAVEDVS